MTGHPLEIQPLSRHRWIVRYAGDVTPLSEHTLTEARQAAINHADSSVSRRSTSFGEPTIHVHELDGEEHDEFVDPDFVASTPSDVKGPHVEP